MELLISRRILKGYFNKLNDSLDLDVAIVGAGPSGLMCAYELAKAQKQVAVFERQLKPGGGLWGGAMLFNDIVFPEEVLPILEELEITPSESENGVLTADAIEVASALVYRAVHAGTRIFNCVTVEDVVFKNGRVAGVVVNWSPVLDQGLHVDPLALTAKCVLDATGHNAELTAKFREKAQVELDTKTGGVIGEHPMCAETGERAAVEYSGRIFPGLYVSGMAAIGVHGSFRMGAIFGGMFLAGRKVAQLILEHLAGE